MCIQKLRIPTYHISLNRMHPSNRMHSYCKSYVSEIQHAFELSAFIDLEDNCEEDDETHLLVD